MYEIGVNPTRTPLKIIMTIAIITIMIIMLRISIIIIMVTI